VKGHQQLITINGREVLTLADILPSQPGLKALFVAKTPALKSVEAGHYFQGTQGKAFWNKLKEHGILHPTTVYEDDSLLNHSYGLTDIVKVPRDYGNEPSDDEYRQGAGRILELVRTHQPTVIVFVYKRPLDKLLQHQFNRHSRTSYGFNPDLEQLFGARVFVFPMPGTPCPQAQATQAMQELAAALTP
jgi:G:T/U-mismatch repair DNA glycosylase